MAPAAVLLSSKAQVRHNFRIRVILRSPSFPNHTRGQGSDVFCHCTYMSSNDVQPIFSLISGGATELQLLNSLLERRRRSAAIEKLSGAACIDNNQQLVKLLCCCSDFREQSNTWRVPEQHNDLCIMCWCWQLASYSPNTWNSANWQLAAVDVSNCVSLRHPLRAVFAHLLPNCWPFFETLE